MSRKEMIKKRNFKILERFNSLYKKGLRSDVILDQLENEFYLSNRTLANIISSTHNQLKENEKEVLTK